MWPMLVLWLLVDDPPEEDEPACFCALAHQAETAIHRNLSPTTEIRDVDFVENAAF